jgi:putative transposase
MKLHAQERRGYYHQNRLKEIVAFVCTGPPSGRARWTIELIVEEAIKRKIVKTVGREIIRVLLHSHDLKPWREKNVVHTLS